MIIPPIHLDSSWITSKNFRCLTKESPCKYHLSILYTSEQFLGYKFNVLTLVLTDKKQHLQTDFHLQFAVIFFSYIIYSTVVHHPKLIMRSVHVISTMQIYWIFSTDFFLIQLYCIMDLDIKNTKFSSPGRLSAVTEVNCIAVSQKVSTFLQKIEN